MTRATRALLAVAGVAIGVRLLYFATTHSPAFRDPLIDGDYYDYLGQRLASGAGFEPGPFWQPPLYPLILGALYRVFGHELLWPRLLQACLDAATALLAMRVAATLIGKLGWGVAAGLLVALHGPMIFYSGEILPTSAAAFCGMLAVYLAVTLEPGTRRSLACGACVGAGALLVATVVVMILPLAWVLGEKRSSRGWLAVGACVALVASATLANFVRSKELVPISANGGINLYIGNAPDSDRLVAVRPGAAWEALASEPERAGITSSSGKDAYFARRAASACTGDPFGCLWHLCEKARQLLASREIPRNESFDVVERDSPVLRALTPSVGSAFLPYLLLLPLAAAGTVVALRRGKRSDHLVALPLLYLAATLIVFFVTGRYRIQLVPELAVLAALGAHALASDLQNRRREALAAAVTLALGVWPLRLPVDAVPFEAEMHYAIGGRRARLGDDPGAVAAWQKALSLEPGYLEAGFNLGLAFERLGQLEAAAAAYRGVLARHPDNPRSAVRLRQLASPHGR